MAFEDSKIYRGSLLFFHFSAFFIDAFTLYWVISNLKPPIFGGLWAMLTFWGHVLNTIYFGFRSWEDFNIIWEYMYSKKKQVTGFKNSILFQCLFTVTFTAGIIVAILFWGIFMIDREMILPSNNILYPAWVNIIQHVVTAVWICLELLFNKQKNLTLKVDLILVYSFSISYLCWNAYICDVDKCPYPFQRILGLVGNIVFDGVALILVFGILYLKRYFVQAKWGPKHHTSAIKRSPKSKN